MASTHWAAGSSPARGSTTERQPVGTQRRTHHGYRAKTDRGQKADRLGSLAGCKLAGTPRLQAGVRNEARPETPAKPSEQHSLIATITALISVMLICATAIIINVLVTFPKEVYDVAWNWGTR